ncbi:Uncharacterised protein [Candidatus Norongarragalina meridionalis]|nr:Uncharacterised protein [Candidatus Norongarragalina meridionalis]
MTVVSKLSLYSLAFIALFCAWTATLPQEPQHTKQASVTLFAVTSIRFYPGYETVFFANFGRSGTRNRTNDTTDDSPLPFAIENDGVNDTKPGQCVNITIAASNDLAFADDYSNMTICVPIDAGGTDCGTRRAPALANSFYNTYNGITSWTTIRNGRSAPATADIYGLRPRNSSDVQGGTFLIDVNTTIGINESIGYHNVTLTVTATATGNWNSGTNICKL